MDNASDSDSDDWEFEPLRAGHSHRFAVAFSNKKQAFYKACFFVIIICIFNHNLLLIALARAIETAEPITVQAIHSTTALKVTSTEMTAITLSPKLRINSVL